MVIKNNQIVTFAFGHIMVKIIIIKIIIINIIIKIRDRYFIIHSSSFTILTFPKNIVTTS